MMNVNLDFDDGHEYDDDDDGVMPICSPDRCTRRKV